MNENDIKKTNENNSANSDNVKVYNDMEIFDFDAHRKAKLEAEKTRSSTAPKASPKPNPTPKPVAQPSAQSRPVPPKTTAQAAQSSAPRTPKQVPRTHQPSITDIKPDKVVFNASLRKPMGKKSTDNKVIKQKPIKPYKEKTRGANPLAVLSKALIYIAVVLLISALASYFIITVANDVFAFVKADAQIEVVIPEYATLDQIADELHEKQIIKFPKIFVLYSIIRGRDDAVYKAGIYTVSPQQNFDQLYYTFVERKVTTMTEISVTIPEGYTIDDIIKLFVEEKGMGTKEGFVDAIQNGVYDYWFLEGLKVVNPDRKYRLEGYLYPDTYYFYKEWPEEKIIDKMLANFYAKFDIKYKQECEKAGMSIDDVVNLASIIQMEAKHQKDYTIVSSVIHNRLNSAYYMYRLDCDATIQYALPERKTDLTHDDTLIDSPYNSYTHGGLPPGPISNPTLKAIRAALYPEQTSEKYYFFVSDIDGYMLYARNLPEHNANIAKVEKNAAAAGN
ncbi:MAG: endolytic transglycosylase MltG [Clostridia bacterium]|nr:endolytic transglycosylase MltG [Clostridia bacterium]